MGALKKVIALVGGIASATSPFDTGDVKVRSFASSREGGAGELRRIVSSLKSGGIEEVWVLTGCNGHSEIRKITDECRKLKIPLKFFRGLGQVRRELLASG